MKKILLITGLIILVSFTYRHSKSPNFIGKWNNTWDKESCYEFTEDGKYNILYHAWIGEELVPVTHHFLYTAEKYMAGWLLKISNAENNQFINDIYIHFENDTMILTSYKAKKENPTEIDEIQVLVKPDKKTVSKKRSINTSKSVFYIPENYFGLFHVLYDNSMDKEIEKNNRIYRIPDSGILSTAFEARPTDFALKRELFYRGKRNNRLSTVTISNLIEFNNAGAVRPPYCIDSVYVLTLGFNQIEGKRRAKVTDGVFVKNIESFKIDTLKNLINKKIYPAEY